MSPTMTPEQKERARLKANERNQRERLDFLHTRGTYAALADIRMELEYGMRKEAA